MMKLLIVLLIALFGSTFAKVQRAQTKKHALKVSQKLLKHAKHNIHAKVSNMDKHKQKLQNFGDMSFLQHDDVDTMDENQIKFQRWGQFFILEKNGEAQAGVKFFANKDFQEQQKLPENDQEDEYGPISIPSFKSFWIIITPNGCFALASRRNPLTQFVHNVLWNNLLMSKLGFNAGITDLGAFEEGFCAQLNSIAEKMVICFPSIQYKNLFIQMATKYSKPWSFQEAKELDFQVQLSDKDASLLEDYKTRGPTGKKILHKLDPDAGPTSLNSYWRLLQQWSTCSLACGSGTQTRQLICIMGLNGKPCQGSPIQTRMCNEQPCLPLKPTITNTTILPLKIKTFRVSDRPQREQICVIKEGDMELVRDDLPGFARPPRTPVRVVLNNSTLSIFSTDNYADVLFSTTLVELQENDYPKDVNCMQIANSRTSVTKTICAFANSQETQQDIINSWKKAVSLFKYQCFQGLSTKKEKKNKDSQIVIQKEIAVENERNDIVAAVVMDPGEEIQKSFKEIETSTISALTREMKFEHLVEQEELERQWNLSKEKRAKLAQIKESKECLDRMQRKADAVQTTSFEKHGIQGMIEQLKKSIGNMIMNNRVKESNKIRIMRAMKAQETNDDDNEAQSIRSKMKKQLQKSYKKGNKDNCPPTKPQPFKDDYCNKNFNTNPDENEDCKDPDQYCLICCDNEFGSFTNDDRIACMKQCDLGDDDETTKFVWQPRSEKPQ